MKYRGQAAVGVLRFVAWVMGVVLGGGGLLVAGLSIAAIASVSRNGGPAVAVQVGVAGVTIVSSLVTAVVGIAACASLLVLAAIGEHVIALRERLAP